MSRSPWKFGALLPGHNATIRTCFIFWLCKCKWKDQSGNPARNLIKLLEYYKFIELYHRFIDVVCVFCQRILLSLLCFHLLTDPPASLSSSSLNALNFFYFPPFCRNPFGKSTGLCLKTNVFLLRNAIFIAYLLYFL